MGNSSSRVSRSPRGKSTFDTFSSANVVLGYIDEVPEQYVDLLLNDYTKTYLELPNDSKFDKRFLTPRSPLNIHYGPEDAVLSASDPSAPSSDPHPSYLQGTIVSPRGRFTFYLNDILSTAGGLCEIETVHTYREGINLFKYAPVLFTIKSNANKAKGSLAKPRRTRTVAGEATNITLVNKIDPRELRHLLIEPNHIPARVLSRMVHDLAVLDMERRHRHQRNENYVDVEDQESAARMDMDAEDSQDLLFEDGDEKNELENVPEKPKHVIAHSIDEHGDAVKGVGAAPQRVKQDPTYNRVINERAEQLQRELFRTRERWIHSYNRYYTFGSKLYDSVTDNYVLYNIWNVCSESEERTFRQITEELGRHELFNSSDSQVVPKLDNRDHSSHLSKGHESGPEQSTSKLFETVVKHFRTHDTGASSRELSEKKEDSAMINDEYQAQFVPARHKYVMEIVCTALKGINALYNGEGGNLWFGVDEKSCRVRGIHLSPTELYFVEKCIQKGIEQFEVDSYELMRSHDRDMFAKQTKSKHRLSRIDKFLGLKDSDFAAVKFEADDDDEIDTTLEDLDSKLDQTDGEEYGTRSRKSTVQSGSSEEKKKIDKSVRFENFEPLFKQTRQLSMLAQQEMKSETKIRFYPIIDETGHLLKNWYVLHCMVKIAKLKYTEEKRKTQFVNPVDGKIYSKYMEYFVCSIPNRDYYYNNKNQIYNSHTGQPRKFKTRIHNIILTR